MKLCKDCKHCVPIEETFFIFWGRPVYNDLARCRAYLKRVDYVNENHQYGFADIARSPLGVCGADAKKWEPK